MRLLTSNGMYLEVGNWWPSRGHNVHCDDKPVCFASIIRVRNSTPDDPVKAGLITAEEASLLARHLDSLIIMKGCRSKRWRQSYLDRDLAERDEKDAVLRAEQIFNEKFAYRRR